MIGPFPSRPVRVGSTGACFIFCFEPETRVRPLRGAASHEVSCSLQRLQVALRRHTRRPASNGPTSTFDRPHFRCTMRRASAIAGGFGGQPIMRVSAADRSRPCGFGSAFRALRVGPCAARAAGTITVHAGPTGSCVAVSLRRDVPLPELCRTLSQPGRTPAFRQSRESCGNAHGIFAPFAVFPVSGSRRL